MITMDSIPRDASGLVSGEFYLRHGSGTFSDFIGRVEFRNGRSVNKVGGRELLRLVAAVGPDLSFEADADVADVPELKPAPNTSPKTAPALLVAAVAADMLDAEAFPLRSTGKHQAHTKRR